MFRRFITKEYNTAGSRLFISVFLSIYAVFFDLFLTMSVLGDKEDFLKFWLPFKMSSFDATVFFFIIAFVVLLMYIVLFMIKPYGDIIIKTGLVWFPCKFLFTLFYQIILIWGLEGESPHATIIFYLLIVLAIIITPFFVVKLIKNYKLIDLENISTKKTYVISLLTCIGINVVTLMLGVFIVICGIAYIGFG
ncbi:hypothetical protein RBH29_12800 [Herbivorax sp. ANBcel31]|uniref:hypothetical protein n=1 Tax=Herbivorax sp. ANBcel31 TaxID=3069754 RepID=UPI0027B81042|nr:hypothetical protein [Herbivorax sp. ANBcel31]MDQ2087304.1 hypothetical protein [Herbivorax sp. ANBcel31]